jgi:hypothetical protein
MSIDYVLLISVPRANKLKAAPLGTERVETATARVGVLDTTDSDVAVVLSLFKDHKIPSGGSDGDVFIYPAGGTDGGNSGGGDGYGGGTLKARGTFHNKSFWNFRVTHPSTKPDIARFPLEMRFEACVYFGSLQEADGFLNYHLEQLRAVFERVQLVAVTKLA